MTKSFVVLLMIFSHILDDYTLQGILASMKQRSWWDVNSSDRKYRYDYVAALIMHSMSWSFMIMLPIAVYFKWNVGVLYIVVFGINTIIHSVVDDLKANRNKINLITDQIIHMAQIAVTAMVFLIGR